MNIGKKIIVVNQSQEMHDLLLDLQYKIMVTDDCIDCIRKTIRYQPDLVIAEIVSPHLNGFSMAKILKSLNILTPLILTATDKKYRSYALTFSNVQGFLLNPVKGSANTRQKSRAELESIVYNLEKREPDTVEYTYSFRQHEWANLIGKSGQKKILVIEDDSSVQRKLMMLLDATDRYDIFAAKDGLDGVFKAFLIEPDLVLTDIHMPNLDGLAMCQTFYILHKPFPVAFITTLDDPEIHQKANRAHGFVGIMGKNILQDKDQFIKQIDSFMVQADRLKDKWKNQLETKDHPDLSDDLDGTKFSLENLP